MEVFDILFFRGNDIVSDTIITIEDIVNKRDVSLFSHVGIVVDNHILPIPELLDNTLYVMESTCSYEYPGSGDVPSDIYGKRKLGVQIRLLSAVIREYKGKVSYGRLINRPTCTDISNFWNKFKRGGYDALSLLAIIVPCLRPPAKAMTRLLDNVGTYVGETPFVFCSELLAILLIDIGTIPKSVDPSIVMPIDFIGARDLFPPIIREIVPIKY